MVVAIRMRLAARWRKDKHEENSRIGLSRLEIGVAKRNSRCQRQGQILSAWWKGLYRG